VTWDQDIKLSLIIGYIIEERVILDRMKKTDDIEFEKQSVIIERLESIKEDLKSYYNFKKSLDIFINR